MEDREQNSKDFDYIRYGHRYAMISNGTCDKDE